jgi:homoserine kinase type II
LIHELMRLAADSGLEFVPRIHFSRHGSWAEEAGRLWDLSSWMPGVANFHERPTGLRLEAACTALARVHAVWARHAPRQGTCPGVIRRLKRVQEWEGLTHAGWAPRFTPEEDPALQDLAERAWPIVCYRVARMSETLAPWLDRPLPLHPCLCDVWHDHVLFENEKVSGLIDYGATKVDHVTVDLGRLLGSLVGDDPSMWDIGLNAYGSVRRLSHDEETLCRLLDHTGTVLGAATWLLWLYRDRKPFADRVAVARHLGLIVQRMETWERSTGKSGM